jgi:hypothetical protein
VALVVAVAALFRLVFLLRLRATPLAELLDMDSALYWQWAGVIRQSGWLGRQQFFLGPLYPYSLAWLGKLGLATVLQVQVLQCVLSLASVTLMTLTAHRLHGSRWGVVCGLICAGYGLWIYFDSQVLMESLLLALQAVLLWITVGNPQWRMTSRRAASIGLVVGIMALGRATAVLFLVPLAGWIIEQRGWRRGAPAVAAMCALVVATAIPTTVRSWVVGREWIPYTYSTGYNLFVGNGPTANGTFRELFANAPERGGAMEGGALGDGRDQLERRFGRKFSPQESSRFWIRETLDHITAEPTQLLRVLGAKLSLLVNHEEASQVQSSRVFEAVAGPLGWPWIGGFGLVGVFGLAGLVMAPRRSIESKMLAGVWCAIALSSMVFFVTDRYRIHLVPSLVLLLPLPFMALTNSARRREWRGVLGVGLLLLLAAISVFRTVIPMSAEKRAFEVGTTLGDAYLRSGLLAKASEQYAKVIALDRTYRLPNAETRNGRSVRAAVYERDGLLAMEAGNWSRAESSLSIVRVLIPERESIRLPLAEVLAARGSSASALELRAEGDLDSATVVRDLVTRTERAAANDNRVAEEGCLTALNAFAPHWEPAVVALVRFRIDGGDLTRAFDILLQERDAGLRPAVYWAYLAWVLARQGRQEEARDALNRIPGQERARDPVVRAALKLQGAESPRPEVHESPGDQHQP